MKKRLCQSQQGVFAANLTIVLTFNLTVSLLPELGLVVLKLRS